jgi:hypothetical protein
MSSTQVANTMSKLNEDQRISLLRASASATRLTAYYIDRICRQGTNDELPGLVANEISGLLRSI